MNGSNGYMGLPAAQPDEQLLRLRAMLLQSNEEFAEAMIKCSEAMVKCSEAQMKMTAAVQNLMKAQQLASALINSSNKNPRQPAISGGQVPEFSRWLDCELPEEYDKSIWNKIYFILSTEAEGGGDGLRASEIVSIMLVLEPSLGKMEEGKKKLRLNAYATLNNKFKEHEIQRHAVGGEFIYRLSQKVAAVDGD